jgi:hypothetical protein
MNTRAANVLLATLLLAASSASATDFEVMPLAGYRAGGAFRDASARQTRNILEDASFGIALDLKNAPDTQWEMTFSRQDTHIEPLVGSLPAAPLNLRIEYLQLGGTYFFSEVDHRGFDPYVVGGLGITRFTPLRAGLVDRIEPSMNFGIGLRVPISKRVALRIEGRGYSTLLDTNASVFCKSDSADAVCRIRARARALWQVEALVGIAMRL